ILTVHLKRQRCVAAHLDPVEVVAVDDVRRRLPAAAEGVVDEARDRARAELPGRHQIEPELEARLGRNPQRTAPGVRVRMAVGYERERRPAEALDLEPRIVA